MALESASYISDLVSTNPTASDNISQGDDHIRLLKSTLKATFTGITGAVTRTHTDINNLVTLAGSEALTNKTINSSSIGATTPSTGAFTTLSATGNVSFSGTGATTLQVGTSVQRPTAAQGMIRYNTTLATFEGYNGSQWGAIGGGAVNGVFWENDQTVSSNYTITTNKNAMSTGPITIASGVTVTVPSSSRWVVL